MAFDRCSIKDYLLTYLITYINSIACAWNVRHQSCEYSVRHWSTDGVNDLFFNALPNVQHEALSRNIAVTSNDVSGTHKNNWLKSKFLEKICFVETKL